MQVTLIFQGCIAKVLERPQWFCTFFFLTIACLSIATPNIDLMQKLAQERYGTAAVKTILAWNNLIIGAQAIPAGEKLEEVNLFFNKRIRFTTDIDTWQQSDYWATPLETMGRLEGDCEDFTIAKYTSLLLSGVPVEKLRIIYVKVRIGSAQNNHTQAHMVLAYYPEPNAEPLILDNLIGEILPASQRPDLIPVFSFNSAGLWVQGSKKSAGQPEARLSRWRQLLSRMQAEGL